MALVPLIMIVLFVHYLADFVFQTGEMAMNKSSSLYWLTIHGLEYTLVFSLGMVAVWMLPNIGPTTCNWRVPVVVGVVAFSLLNGLLHWSIDLVTSKINAHYWSTQQVSNFWRGIGFDQWCHMTSMLVTYYWIFV
jgi:hypothetical protein